MKAKLPDGTELEGTPEELRQFIPYQWPTLPFVPAPVLPAEPWSPLIPWSPIVGPTIIYSVQT